MPLAIDISDIELSALTAGVSASSSTVLLSLEIGFNVQVYCDAPSSQVIDPQYATYYIPTQVVKDQHLPNRFAIRVEDRCGLRDQTVGRSRFMVKISRILRHVIEVQYALDRSCRRQ